MFPYEANAIFVRIKCRRHNKYDFVSFGPLTKKKKRFDRGERHSWEDFSKNKSNVLLAKRVSFFPHFFWSFFFFSNLMFMGASLNNLCFNSLSFSA